MMPIYIGARVKLSNPEILCGDAKRFYDANTYIYVRDIWENTVLVGSLSGSTVTVDRSCVIDVIPEEHILSLLKRKKDELNKLQEEVKRIKEYINWKCSMGGDK